MREKLVDLVRGEDGVALVVTLAAFFLMYLLIAGIYAVGTAVKQRIQLQNAVDAAAYSAAVVQADTLSRIATINRAMAWTYAEMTRKQMDVVTHRWLTEVLRHWRQDRAAAIANATGGRGCGLHGHITRWSITNPVLTLAGGSRTVSSGSIAGAVGGFPYGTVTASIDQDRNTLALMNAALDSLENTSSYTQNVTAAVAAVARANLGSKDEKWVKKGGNLPNGVRLFTDVAPIGVSLEQLQESGVVNANLPRENRFFKYIRGNSTLLTELGVSGDSLAGWFRQDSIGRFRGDGFSYGFRRHYTGSASGALRANWSWISERWHCSPLRHNVTYAACPHGNHDVGRCSCTPIAVASRHTATVTADNNGSFNGYYSTPLHNVRGGRTNYDARPRILNSGYFGPAGTITVGLTVPNANPWASIMSVGGIYRAFDHYCGNTVVFASAKAGYRNYTAGKTPGRDYRIDWRRGDIYDSDDEQYWNLYTSDWDAVMVPVRMANSSAVKNNSWSYTRANLAGWLTRLGVGTGSLVAGGTVTPDTSVIDQMDDDSSVDRWRWYNWQLRQNTHNAGKVQAQWRIQNPGGRLNLNRLADRMFH